MKRKAVMVMGQSVNESMSCIVVNERKSFTVCIIANKFAVGMKLIGVWQLGILDRQSEV